MPTIVCSCCKREIRADAPQGLCWECRGRPSSERNVKLPAGLRDPACPHDIPGGR